MIKAVFFDIDGTLVSFKTHKVSDSSKEAIRILKEKGIKVFIATGRIKMHINNVDDLEFDGYITANGFDCYIGDKSVNEDVEKVSKSINLPIPAVDNYYEFLEKNIDDILQINLFVNEEKEKELMSKIFKNCESSRWHPALTDVNTKGGGKHIGIDKIIEYYGIDLSETMAFGDGGNDITMIEHAAIGVAMGNANEGVKEVADYITDDVDSDGVYKALKHFNVL